MAEVKFEIKETIISVNDGDAKWNLELNLVSWNGREPKYDIRKWSPDHTKMGKGVSLSEDEAILFFQQTEKFLGRFRTEPVKEPEQVDFHFQSPQYQVPGEHIAPPEDTSPDFALPFD